MTGRTHDLAAFTALSYIVATQPLPSISLATGLVALSANFIGGLAPDIDQPTADLWHRLPAGSVIGHMLSPFLGGHRSISHSILGIFLFGFGLKYILAIVHHTVLVDIDIVWWAFMIGFFSHLVMDTFTREGVPWLFPLPIHFGILPFRALRFKTGGFIEKGLIFPGLLIVNVVIFYAFHDTLLHFLKHTIQ